MRHAIRAHRMLLLLVLVLSACAAPPKGGNELAAQINDVLVKSAAERKPMAADGSGYIAIRSRSIAIAGGATKVRMP